MMLLLAIVIALAITWFITTLCGIHPLNALIGTAIIFIVWNILCKYRPFTKWLEDTYERTKPK